jgi:ring-1,2-phenylacetyl-CoA epoxidase subunit PaaE
LSTKFYPLTIAAIEPETSDCVSMVLEVPKNLQSVFKFQPGQNLTFRIFQNGIEHRRNYSICSGVNDNEWRVAVKKIPNGIFTNYIHHLAKAGESIEVLPPTGHFTIPALPDEPVHLLAIAAGSGITPILSMIKSTLQNYPKAKFTLIYGNSFRHSIIFREQLENLKNQYIDRLTIHYLLSREKMSSELHTGRISPEKLEQFKGKLIHYDHIQHVFVCGPAELIFSTKEYFLNQGLSNKQIHFELFNAPTAPVHTQQQSSASGDQKMSQVEVKVDGIQFSFPLAQEGISLLDAALAEGANLPFACKGGVCSTCKAKLTKGTVRMDQNYALEEDEVEQGYILTCQSHPTSDCVSVDFDH